MYLPSAFEFTDDVTVRGSTHFGPPSRIGIGALIMTLPSPYEWDCRLFRMGSNELTSLEIGKDACRFESVTEFDLSKYPKLKSLWIGRTGFEYVNELSIIGLSELERVVIGDNCFTQHMEEYGGNPNRHFYLKNCPKLKSLKIGRYSFSDYTVIEIENMDSLEVIEIGDVNEWGYSFYYASLELKSILIHKA